MTPLAGQDSRETPSPLQVYLKVLRDRWLLIVAVFIVTVASAVVFTVRQTPVYQAAATVLIEPEAPRVVNIQGVTPETSNSQEYYATQYKVLQSRPIVDAVIKRLDLKRRMPGVGGAEDPYSAVVGGLTIDPLKNTRLVLVKFDDADPKLATEIANAVAQQFVNYNLEMKQTQ